VVDGLGWTALWTAVNTRNKALVCKLLAMGANANLGDRSPLMMASCRSAEMVSILRAAGADVNHRDDEGNTPVQVAADGGHTDIVRLLLDAYVDKDTVSAKGQQTLMRAEQQNRDAVVEVSSGCMID
jgi:uncharacterized protein